MTLSTELFENAPAGIGGVLSHVFQIFGEHWKPLVMITGMQMIASTGVFLVLGALTWLLLDLTLITSILGMLHLMPDSNSRHLLVDYSVGVSGTSRFLSAASRFLDQDYYSGYGQETNLPDINIGALIAMMVVLVVVLSLVGSIFAGAFCHAIAEIYTGVAPSPVNSVRKGMEKMWKVFLFQLILSFLVLLLFIITVVPSVDIFLREDQPNVAVIILGYISFSVGMVLMITFLVAAIPTIIVEGKNPVEALKRSYHLCKDFFFFIFCSISCFNAGLFIVMRQLSQQPIITCSYFLKSLQVVLYMAMRIRSEQYTMDELAGDIGTGTSYTIVVEMHDKETKLDLV
eukprot:scaffold687_cov288-Chaetoceros_neogracile.AAC.11